MRPNFDYDNAKTKYTSAYPSCSSSCLRSISHIKIIWSKSSILADLSAMLVAVGDRQQSPARRSGATSPAAAGRSAPRPARSCRADLLTFIRTDGDAVDASVRRAVLVVIVAKS